MISKANIQKIIFSFFFLLILSCSSNEGEGDGCFPDSTINVSLNLSLAAYQSLQQTGGWIYYSGDLAGSRGLIIVNIGNGFKAYDRNAPHICPTVNSTLEVENDFIIVCPEDDAQWILTTGEPVAVANRAPVSYFTAYGGGILTVTNR